MEENDWIDDVLDDEECSLYQIGKIESLLVTSASNIYYENINLETLTYNEAEAIIQDLYTNNCTTDTREQFKQMSRAGVFK